MSSNRKKDLSEGTGFFRINHDRISKSEHEVPFSHGQRKRIDPWKRGRKDDFKSHEFRFGKIPNTDADEDHLIEFLRILRSNKKQTLINARKWLEVSKASLYLHLFAEEENPDWQYEEDSQYVLDVAQIA